MHDREFLLWLWNRLKGVHGENPNVDYMNKLWSIMHATPCDQLTPNIGQEGT